MPQRLMAQDFDRKLLNNDTTPRHDAAAAQQAWERTVAFFKANLA